MKSIYSYINRCKTFTGSVTSFLMEHVQNVQYQNSLVFINVAPIFTFSHLSHLVWQAET